MSAGEASPLKTERRRDWAALSFAVLLIALAVAIANDAGSLPSGAATYARIGPAAFPYAIAAGLAALGIANAVKSFRGTAVARDSIEAAPILWILAGLIIQIVVMPAAGFSLASGAVLAFTARAFGRGPLVMTYAVGVLAALAIWLAFATGLKLVLPGGALEHFAQSEVEMMIDLIRNALG